MILLPPAEKLHNFFGVFLQFQIGVDKKRGRATEKAKVFVVLSLDARCNTRFLKMWVTPNIKQASVKKFAQATFGDNSEDGYRSYIPALERYTHEHKPYDPHFGLLHWPHIVISNANAFILGTYLGACPRSTFNPIWNSFHFSRRDFSGALVDHLAD